MNNTKLYPPLLLIAVLISSILSGCSYDEEDGNLVEVSYANDIVPLLDANCYSCHEDEDNYTGLCLSAYELVSDLYNREQIIDRISRDISDDMLMPKAPAAPLTESQIDIFKAWVEQGAQNN